MRAIKRKRPPLRNKGPQSGLDFENIAKRARYTGSPEHKDHKSFVGQPKRRSDASVCDVSLATKKREITKWLKNAIKNKQIGEFFEGDFPRYVWHKEEDVVYEARLINRTTGEYKGYPLLSSEAPSWI